MTSLLDFHEGRLDNGVRYAWAEMPEAGYPDAFFSIRLTAGAVYEPADEIGRTHFLEHLLVDHTAEADANPFVERLERLTGRSVSASSGYELISSENRCPVADLPELIRLWAGQLGRRGFLSAVVEKQRQIILREIGPAASSPLNRHLRDWLADFLSGHPYARPVAGTEASVAALTQAQLEAALAQECVAPNLHVVGAGALPVSAFADYLDAAFGTLPGGPANAFPSGEVPWPEPAERAASPEGVFVPMIYWWVRTPGARDPDYHLGRATFDYLGGALNAPLYRKLRDERQLCYQVSASYDGYRTRGGVSIFQVLNPPRDRLDEARDVLRETIDELAAGVVDHARLAQMKNALVRTYFGQVIEPPGTQVALAAARLLGQPMAHPAAIRAFYEQLEPDQLVRFASTYLAGRGQLTLFTPPAPTPPPSGSVTPSG